MRRSAAVCLALLAGCGGSGGATPPRERATPAATATAVLENGETGAGAESTGPAVPDGGVATGHGTEPAERFAERVRGRVRVPERDRTPPLALLRLDVDDPIVHDSPVRSTPLPPVVLADPELRATGLVRDTDGGTGRIRVSVVYVTRCGDDEQQHAGYFPPAQVETVRIAPGTLVPAQRSRRARVRFPAGCAVRGKVFAEATNAHSLESFSDPIQFVFRPR
jgi:hypothetical protein